MILFMERYILWTFMVIGMISKLAYKIPMRIVWQQWGSIRGCVIRPTQQKRAHYHHLKHFTGTTLQHGSRRNLRRWHLRHYWRYQGLIITVGAWTLFKSDYFLDGHLEMVLLIIYQGLVISTVGCWTLFKFGPLLRWPIGNGSCNITISMCLGCYL